MSVLDRILTAMTRTIQLDSKVDALMLQAREQQHRLEQIAERLVRIETILDLSAAAQTRTINAPPRLPSK